MRLGVFSTLGVRPYNARQQPGQHHSHRMDVAVCTGRPVWAVRNRPPGSHLAQVRGVRLRLYHARRQREIQQPGAVLRIDQDVAGLQPAVHQSGSMGQHQSIEQLNHPGRRFTGRHRRGATQQVCQRLAGNPATDQKRLSILDAGFEQRHDGHMGDVAGVVGLMHPSGHRRRIDILTGFDHFQTNFACRFRVVGVPYPRPGALKDQPAQGVPPERIGPGRDHWRLQLASWGGIRVRHRAGWWSVGWSGSDRFQYDTWPARPCLPAPSGQARHRSSD